MSSLATLAIYLLAGLGGGLLALRTGIPAAPLAGALLGAGLVSMSGRWDVAHWPPGTRTGLEIAIGTVMMRARPRVMLRRQLLNRQCHGCQSWRDRSSASFIVGGMDSTAAADADDDLSVNL